VGTMICRPLSILLAIMQADGELMMHNLFRKIVVCPAKSKLLIDTNKKEQYEFGTFLLDSLACHRPIHSAWR
jgi:hypothetical protein